MEEDELLFGPMADHVRRAVSAAMDANWREMNSTQGWPDFEAHKRRVREARDKAIAEWKARNVRLGNNGS